LPSSPLLPLSPAEGAFSGMKVTSMHTLEGGSQCCQFLQNWAILQCCHVCVVSHCEAIRTLLVCLFVLGVKTLTIFHVSFHNLICKSEA